MMRCDYVAARRCFQRLLKERKVQSLSTEERAILVIRLATAENELGYYGAAERRLSDLETAILPPHRLLEAQLLLARVYSHQGKARQALATMASLSQMISADQWRREDRAFFTALKTTMGDQFDQTLKKAERAQEQGLYEEAHPLYCELLTAVCDGCYPASGTEEEIDTLAMRLRYRLAEIAYFLGKDDEVSYYLDTLAQQVTHRSLFVLGMSQSRQGHYSEALGHLLGYLETAGPADRGAALFEAGRCTLCLGEPQQAIPLFEQVIGEDPNKPLASRARLYLARAHLAGGDPETAQQILLNLLPTLPEGRAITYEAEGLLGEVALAQGDPLMATRFFEGALPKRNLERARWAGDTLNHLGSAYLALAAQVNDRPSKEAAYSRAEDAFRRLMALGRDERSYLGLARTFVAREGKSAHQRVEQLLAKPSNFSSVGGAAEALLIRAQANPSFSEREALYEALSNERYADAPSYSLGWLHRGDHQLHEAKTEAQYECAAKTLTRALEHLEKAWQLEGKKLLAQARFHQGQKRVAIDLLGNIPLDEEGEYLLGLFAAMCGVEEGDDSLTDLAGQRLWAVFRQAPKSKWAPQALSALGTLYFQLEDFAQAESAFVQLGTIYAKSSEARNAWFWAAESADRQAKDQQLIRRYRQQAFDGYPNSEFAPEAYFNTYGMAQYVRGDPEAIDHLSHLPERFPSSPYGIVAHYLLGLQLKGNQQPLKAIEAFERGVKAFSECVKLERIRHRSLEYYRSIRLRCLQEEALTYAQMETGAEQAIALLQQICHELDGVSIPRILEESEQSLIHLLLQQGQEEEGVALIEKVLSRYEQAGVRHGYYLARAWIQKGELALTNSAFKEALKAFEEAQQTATGGLLPSEQQLQLWLDRSTCHQELGDFDQAMLLLAKVINHEAASAKRVEAMFRRAQIYELQGKDRLAMRQLEATAQKGGSWALEAKEKLRREYGFQ